VVVAVIPLTSMDFHPPPPSVYEVMEYLYRLSKSSPRMAGSL
jgi:hypothetical protein